jgi:hypothetical protein
MCNKNIDRIEQVKRWVSQVNIHDYDIEEFLEDLCNKLGIDNTKTIQVEGVVNFKGTVTIPIGELFDADDYDLSPDISDYDDKFTLDSAQVDELRVV